jgi:hypothetical protein
MVATKVLKQKIRLNFFKPYFPLNTLVEKEYTNSSNLITLLYRYKWLRIFKQC